MKNKLYYCHVQIKQMDSSFCFYLLTLDTESILKFQLIKSNYDKDETLGN